MKILNQILKVITFIFCSCSILFFTALGLLVIVTGGYNRDNYIYIAFTIIHFLLLTYTLYCFNKVNKSRKHYTKLIFILGIIINYMTYKHSQYLGYDGDFLDIISGGSLLSLWPVFLIYLSTALDYFTCKKYNELL